MSDIAIVFGVDTQIGLALVRELGQHGCAVVAVGKSPDSIGLRSKYATHKYVLEKRDDQSKVDLLHLIHQQTGATSLLCVSEDDILFFNRVKEQLKPIQPLIPEQAVMDLVLDKNSTAEYAQKVGIASPKSWQMTDINQSEQIKSEVRYPLILKWSNPHDVMKSAGQLGLAVEKIIYCYNAEQLHKWMHYYAPLKAWPMIQEYYPGYGLGQFFFMHEDRDLLRFQHQRIHEWPPEGGFSSLCKSMPLHEHQALQERSLALLRELKWQGAAMVEYRYDPQTKSAILMEINGRFWGSLPLAYHSKVPFAWYTYKVLGLNQIPSESLTPLADIQCRNTLVEFKRLFRILFQKDRIKDKSLVFSASGEITIVIAGFFNPRMRYYLFEWGDLGPWLADMQVLTKKLFRKLLGK